MKSLKLNWRIIFIIIFISFIFICLRVMYSTGSGIVKNGEAELTGFDFNQENLVALDGQWEFYWKKLLTRDDFTNSSKPHIDSYIKVPGSWHDKSASKNIYPEQGYATYRIKIKYPQTLVDPALRIQRVSAAFKLFANGKLLKEVGRVSNTLSKFKGGYEQVILGLPNTSQTLDIIIQVANHDYSRGGLRESPIFGSKKTLESQKNILFSVQLLFIGSVFMVGIYYILLFLLQLKNWSALLFSLICFNTALHSSLWGETPLLTLFPSLSITNAIYITYATTDILVPTMILFIYSMFPNEFRKSILVTILLPNLFFCALLFTNTELMSLMSVYFFALMLLQMFYMLYILIISVLRKRNNAIILLVAMGVFVLAIIADILSNVGLSSINLSYMSLYGNFAVILAMAFVQAKQQSNNYKKLVSYNENLIEADRLKDKIMATEMSFLQAQIKPHFLYNTLNAIANICEKDGKRAGKLIIDLAVYLRGSLEFNHLDKMVTIEKELEFVDTYFNIEQARFGQKIQLIKEIAIPLDTQIPVLIIQPLVENAVRHGISKRTEGGIINLRMKTINEGTYIEIIDDGVGIESDKLLQLLKKDNVDKCVGLINIHNRLMRLYGKGIEISSQVGHGTCVKLVLPKKVQDNIPLKKFVFFCKLF